MPFRSRRSARRSATGSPPVTEVDFDQRARDARQQLQVKVTLGVDELDYFEQVRAALENQKSIALPQSNEEWERFRQDFAAAFRPVVGRANAKVDAATRTGPNVKGFLPRQRSAPEWVNDDFSVQGTATAGGASAAAKLKARQTAEANARAALRSRIESLPFDKDTTVGQTAKDDPRFDAAVRRAIDRTRPTKTDYRPDGTVVVHLTHDLRNLWDELRRF